MPHQVQKALVREPSSLLLYKQNRLSEFSGFKSVFTVADMVHISSGEYTFRFDKHAVLGMITPIWDPGCLVEPGWTTFRLQLGGSENGQALSKLLTEIQPSALLFLRQLRSLEFHVKTLDRQRPLVVTIERVDSTGDIISLVRHENGNVTFDQNFMLIRHSTPTYQHEDKRQGIHESEVVLAFPVGQSGTPVIAEQDVHAFLPLRRYGFNVSAFFFRW